MMAERLSHMRQLEAITSLWRYCYDIKLIQIYPIELDKVHCVKV